MSENDYLKEIAANTRTIKNILIFYLILGILAAVLGFCGSIMMY